MKFAFIRQYSDQFSVGLLCNTLQVSRSGYYAWRDRPVTKMQGRRKQLLEAIRQTHQKSRAIYGAPRIHRALRAQGHQCSENTVAKLMRQNGIRSKIQRRFRIRTTDSKHQHPVAKNELDRQFQHERPNKAWAADITYVATDEGWLYLAAIIDLCSRKVVGWAAADHLRTELVCDALRMAITHRNPQPGLLHHSDRGVQYAGADYQELLAQYAIRPSMSNVADCYDNAVMESFFATLKRECVYHEHYSTRYQARQDLFEYIEVFYNRTRLHSTLGYRSPDEFEQKPRNRQKRG